MEIRTIPVSLIKLHPENPRISLTQADEEYRQIDKSISTFGLVQPLIWNEKSQLLISGEQRLAVLVAKGTKEVPVVVVNLDDVQSKKLMVAMNKVGGKWNYEKLGVMLEDLLKFPDIDLDSIGFTLPEASKIIDDATRIEEDDFVPAATNDKEVITQPNELICLGEHRILCADSTKIESLELLMGGLKAQMGYTDPPYRIDYDSQDRPVDSGGPKKWDPIIGDNLTVEAYEIMLRSVFANMGKFLDEGANCYAWNSCQQFYFMYRVLTELDYHVSSVITWVKDSFSLSFAPYNWQSEHCLYFWKKGNGPHKWYGGNNQSNCWYASRDGSKNLAHPTQKPTSLAAKAIKNSSKRSDIILDLFAGVGGTLIAAQQLGRRCFAVEISPSYVDALVRRYGFFVGKENLTPEIRARYFKEA